MRHHLICAPRESLLQTPQPPQQDAQAAQRGNAGPDEYGHPVYLGGWGDSHCGEMMALRGVGGAVVVVGVYDLAASRSDRERVCGMNCRIDGLDHECVCVVVTWRRRG
jgi:hypothetical protein